MNDLICLETVVANSVCNPYCILCREVLRYCKYVCIWVLGPGSTSLSKRNFHGIPLIEISFCNLCGFMSDRWHLHLNCAVNAFIAWLLDCHVRKNHSISPRSKENLHFHLTGDQFWCVQRGLCQQPTIPEGSTIVGGPPCSMPSFVVSSLVLPFSGTSILAGAARCVYIMTICDVFVKLLCQVGFQIEFITIQVWSYS
jgi:hypothetical protein